MSDLDRLHDNCVDAKALNQDRHLDELYELLTRMVALHAAAATPTRPAPAPTMKFHSSEGLTGGGPFPRTTAVGGGSVTAVGGGGGSGSTTLRHPIRDEFAVHLLNEQGQRAAETIAMAFTELLNAIEPLLPRPGEEPEGRDWRLLRALVVGRLQEAAFWAKRCIAVRPENQTRGDQ